jgi:tetratricopeptide (TPR) repeat protein
VKRDLRGLSKEGAEFVAQHLVAAGTLADEEPALAWRHARAARQKGGRIAVVRETVGLVAYRAGEWSEAIAELRAARRMGGGPGHLAVMADCERALGHPEKAIELSRSAEAAELDDDGAIEMTIVVAGARADLGQLDAAMVMLEEAGVTQDGADARLLYAYADLLAGAGRTAEALNWFMKAYDADTEDDTDAADRITELAEGMDQPKTTDRPAGPADTVLPDEAGEADEPAVPEEPVSSDEIAQADEPAVPEEPVSSDDAGEADEPEQPESPVSSDETAQADEPAVPEEPGSSDDAGEADEPEQPEAPVSSDETAEADEPAVPERPDDQDRS